MVACAGFLMRDLRPTTLSPTLMFLLVLFLHTLVGCGKLIGLDGYKEGSAGGSGGGNGNREASGGTAGSANTDSGGRASGGFGGSAAGGAETTGGLGGVAASGGAAETGGAQAGGAETGGAGTGGAGTGGAGTNDCPSDCDDSNPCTEDSCEDKTCVHRSASLGTACMAGVCNGAVETPSCVRCIDDQEGEETDTGCSAAAPRCHEDGIPVCVGCEEDLDCGPSTECTQNTCSDQGVCDRTLSDSGAPCSDGVCSLGMCIGCRDDDDCQDSGDACSPNACNAQSECETIDVRRTVALIDEVTLDGSFELGGWDPSTTWTETGPLITVVECQGGCGAVETVYAARSGIYLAWLGGSDDLTWDEANPANNSGINQVIALPAGAVSLRLRADLNIQTEDVPSGAYDQMRIILRNATYEPLTTLGSWDNRHASPTLDWELDRIDLTTDVTSLDTDNVRVTFESMSDASLITDFFIDNVRLDATVCP